MDYRGLQRSIPEGRRALRNNVSRPFYPLRGVCEIKVNVGPYLDMLLWTWRCLMDSLRSQVTRAGAPCPLTLWRAWGSALTSRRPLPPCSAQAGWRLSSSCNSAEITPISPTASHARGYDCLLLFHFILDPFSFLLFWGLLRFPGLLTLFLLLSGIFEFFPAGWGGLIPLGTGLSELLLRTL